MSPDILILFFCDDFFPKLSVRGPHASEYVQFILYFFVLSTVRMAQHHATSAVSYNGSPTSSHVCDLHRHRRCMFHGRCTRPSAIVPSPSPLQRSGTRFRRRSHHYRHWRHSSASVDHTAMHTTSNSSIATSATCDTQFSLRLAEIR